MFEILNRVWDALHYKPLVVFFLIGAFLTEILSGYFKVFPAYLKSLNFRRVVTPIAGVIILFLAALFFLDEASQKFIPHIPEAAGSAVLNYGAEMGRSIWIVLFLAYLFSVFNRKARQTVFGAVLATCLTGLSATVLKHLFLRARPDTGKGAFAFFNWDNWVGDNRAYQSFPSGDVSIVAGASLFLMIRFRRQPLAAVLFALTPMATAFARVYYNRHWVSDTWMALCIGFACGLLFERYSRFKESSKIPA